jgi:disulfide bond formation protein DsbB
VDLTEGDDGVKDRLPALLLLLASLGVLAAAFTAQYGFGILPCPLCLYQRIPYGTVIALALLALVLRLESRLLAALLGLCALAFLTNSGLALYHVGVEQHWWAGPDSCSAGKGAAQSVEDLLAQLSKPVKIPACDQVSWSLFGISLAGYNLLASAGLAAFSSVAARRGWERKDD